MVGKKFLKFAISSAWLKPWVSIALGNFYENYIIGSEYLCDDGITFMFLTADDKLHTLYIDMNKKCIKEA